MNDFFIKKTFNTPEINFLPAKGTLTIEGRSIPEDPVDFYSTVMAKLEEYYKNPRALTIIEIRLEYINSGSAKYLIELLRLVKDYYESGNNCLINWYYEEDDESIYDLGLHFQSIFQMPFSLIIF